MRPIDADKIVFCNEIIADESGDMAEFLVAYKEDVDKLPTIEAEPVVHAHWIIVPDEPGAEFADICSACRKPSWYASKSFKYCPHCGARMTKEVLDDRT